MGSIVKGMAKCKNLNNLTHLNLQYSRIHDHSVQIIASSPLFSNLTFLNLSDTKIGRKSVKFICSSPYLSKLKDLNLAWCNLGNVVLFEISQSSHLKNLTSLNLARNNISIEGVKCICQSSNFNNLTCLSLNNNNISTEGIEYLTCCENLSNLEEFSVETNAKIYLLPMNIIFAIFNGPMKKIKSIRVSPNTYDEFQEFITCKNITSLKSLDMGFCRSVSNDFLKLVMNCQKLSQLESLKIGYTNISDYTPLIAIEYMKNLTLLDVSDLKMNSSNLLAISKTFPKLKVLNISQTEISFESVIESLNNFECLETLYIQAIDLVSCEKVQQFACHPAATRLKSLCCTHQHGFISYLFGTFSKLENLTHLNLRGPCLNLEDVQILTSNPKLAKLSSLFLPGVTEKNLKKQTVALLESSPYLRRLNAGDRNHWEGVFY